MAKDLSTKPLVVDLDGSLIKTDLVYETCIKAVYQRPWILFLLPVWLLAGIPRLKQQLYTFAMFDVQCLPWNEAVVDYVKQEHSNGRKLILCTGSWHELAEQVAEYLGIFSEVFGTKADINLTGYNKAHFLVEQYGEGEFVYLGNESKDEKVWQYAAAAVVAESTPSLLKLASHACEVEKSFDKEALSFKTVLRQMRVHQWVKNTLIFIPLITSHQTNNIELLVGVMIAFFAYSLCASATYILNDLSDLESDRKHARKRFRPLASGALSIPQSIVISAILLLGSALLCLQLPLWFGLSLGLYIMTTLSYSFKFKRMQTLDIIVLAGLYTLRIISGAIAINLLPSFWLLAFSMFVFLCLAIIKRLSEIIKNQDKYEDGIKISGRGYYVSDFHILMSLATASGMLSVLVFAMYINSPEVAVLYATPYVLWLICPLFAYWIVRVLIMAARGEIDEDPIVFAIKDRRSWATGAAILAIIFLSNL